MPSRHVVVDGSNLATEGRSLPSLEQLDQAVREFIAENPDDRVTVVVDATFAHRIDPSELPVFEEAEAAGEVVSPPAGAVGRGDAFLLRVAEKTGATVLSNDSFQEFHAEHPWLFDSDRLIGGKPVPGVGWVFVARTPVRGPKSREVTKQARKKKQAAASSPRPDQTGLELAASKAKDKRLDRAIARATEEVITPEPPGRRRRRRAGEPPSDPVNEPLAFITFIAAHPLGSEIAGVVEEFSSHGAFVRADGARCYVPLSALGEPSPRRAREVLSKGEERAFVIQALDPPRRGIELALPGFAHVAGVPTAETVEAEIHPTFGDEEPVPARPRRGRAVEKAPGAAKRTATAKAKEVPSPAAPGGRRKAGAEEPAVAAPRVAATTALPEDGAKKTVAKKVAAKKATVTPESTAKKVPARVAKAKKTPSGTPTTAEPKAAPPAAGKAAGAAAPAAKAPVKPPAARKGPVEPPAATKAPAKRSTAARKAPLKPSAMAKKAPAKKTPPEKTPVSARAGANKDRAKAVSAISRSPSKKVQEPRKAR